MSQPSGSEKNQAPGLYEIMNEGEERKAEKVDTGQERNTSGEQTVTGQAIKAAYEASRNGNPKAFADAFEGAVKSLIGDEIHRVLNERDAAKGY